MSTPREDTPSGEAKRELRRLLADRDGARCFYCQEPFPEMSSEATLDHYVPYALWQGWQPANLVLACRSCNGAKADLLPWPLVWLLRAHFPQEWAEAEAAYVPPAPKPPRPTRMRSRRREFRFYLLERDGWHCRSCRRPIETVADAIPYRLVPRTIWPSNLPLLYAVTCPACSTPRGETLAWPLAWLVLANHNPVLTRDDLTEAA